MYVMCVLVFVSVCTCVCTYVCTFPWVRKCSRFLLLSDIWEERKIKQIKLRVKVLHRILHLKERNNVSQINENQTQTASAINQKCWPQQITQCFQFLFAISVCLTQTQAQTRTRTRICICICICVLDYSTPEGDSPDFTLQMGGLSKHKLVGTINQQWNININNGTANMIAIISLLCALMCSYICINIRVCTRMYV